MEYFKVLPLWKRIIVIFCIVQFGAGLGWLIFISPRTYDLSQDFKFHADLISHDNFFDETTGRFSGEITSNTDFYYEVIGQEKDNLLIKNVFDVHKPNGEKIIQIERTYNINKRTGEHVKNHGERSLDGYLFAPRNLKPGQNYQYRHVNYDKSLEMVFEDEEVVSGLMTFRYRSQFQADQTKDLDHLPGVPEERGINLDVDLTLWVEPKTGRMVKYEDEATAYYYDIKTGARGAFWNKFGNEFTESSINASAESTRRLLSQHTLLAQILPFGLMTAGAFGLMLAVISSRKRMFALPFLLLAGGIILSIIVYKTGNGYARTQFDLAYDNRTNRIKAAIEQRLSNYTTVLYGGQGLFNSFGTVVSRQQWKDFIASYDIQSRLPGVQGISYVQKVALKDIDQFTRSVKQRDKPNFTISPSGLRQEYFPVLYIEPENNQNEQVIGLDVYNDPMRKAAIDLARKSGQVAFTGRLVLAQDATNQNYGFIIYSPVYLAGKPTLSQRDREDNLLGLVGAPFRAVDFFESVTNAISEDIKFEVYSGPISKNEKIYDNKDPKINYANYHTKNAVVKLNGEEWHIRFYADHANLPIAKRSQSWTSIVLINLIAILVCSVIIVLQKSSSRAQKIAERMTQDAHKSQSAAIKAAEEARKAKGQIEQYSKELIERNSVLEDTKKATLNILADLKEEKIKAENERIKGEALFDSIGEGLIAFNEYGNITNINQAAQKILGFKKENLVDEWFPKAIVAVDDKGNSLAPSDRPMVKALESGKAVSTKLNYLKHNGEALPVFMTAAPFLVEGKPAGGVVVFRDFSHEAAVEKAKDEFVSVTSHQLRTPLTSIRLFAELLEDKATGPLNAKQDEYLDNIQTSTIRMIRLVSDILNLSRLELGRLKIEPKLLRLEELIHQQVIELTPIAQKKKLAIVFHAPKPALPQIKIDENLFDQVLHNLLTNAVRYTPEGGEDIVVSLSKTAHGYNINVTDKGIGIPEEAKPKLFSRFFRADNAISAEGEGSGLGLYLIKQILETSGGKVSYTSHVNKGTNFCVTIPLSGMRSRKGEVSLTTFKDV